MDSDRSLQWVLLWGLSDNVSVLMLFMERERKFHVVCVIWLEMCLRVFGCWWIGNVHKVFITKYSGTRMPSNCSILCSGLIWGWVPNIMSFIEVSNFSAHKI